MTQNDAIEEATESVLEGKKKHLRALRLLLDSQSEEEGHLLTCRAEMGGTSSYITSVPLEWVANRINFAGDLPLFKGKVDPSTKRVPVDEETVRYIQQRPPDWRRQIVMTVYLAMREHRKFPPLLVAAYQPWVYQEGDEWSAGKAMRDSINVVPLDNKGFYYDLDSANTHFYALDGQHRLMAILGLRDLVKNKCIYAKKVDGTNQGNPITMDEVIDELERIGGEKHEAEVAFQNILNGRIGIEIIPAVTQKDTFQSALFRLRNMFVDVNENAKKVTTNEANQLDEIIGFRIVARNTMVSNNLLREKTDLNSMQLAEASEMYTTLDTVAKIAKLYLGQLPDFASWERPLFGKKGFGFIRPSDDEIREATVELSDYFNALSKLPSHERFINGVPAGKIRRAPKSDDDQTADYEDNILFRPVAQAALAKALGCLVKEEKIDVPKAVSIIARQEKQGQLKLTDPKTLWFGVLCDPHELKMRRHTKYQHLATGLFIYLLGGGYDTEERQEELRADLWEARGGNEKRGEDAYNFDGKKVSQNDFRLPAPWR